MRISFCSKSTSFIKLDSRPTARIKLDLLKDREVISDFRSKDYFKIREEHFWKFSGFLVERRVFEIWAYREDSWSSREKILDWREKIVENFALFSKGVWLGVSSGNFDSFLRDFRVSW